MSTKAVKLASVGSGEATDLSSLVECCSNTNGNQLRALRALREISAQEEEPELIQDLIDAGVIQICCTMMGRHDNTVLICLSMFLSYIVISPICFTMNIINFMG